jgi:hypothetical protein
MKRPRQQKLLLTSISMCCFGENFNIYQLATLVLGPSEAFLEISATLLEVSTFNIIFRHYAEYFVKWSLKADSVLPKGIFG